VSSRASHQGVLGWAFPGYFLICFCPVIFHRFSRLVNVIVRVIQFMFSQLIISIPPLMENCWPVGGGARLMARCWCQLFLFSVLIVALVSTKGLPGMGFLYPWRCLFLVGVLVGCHDCGFWFLFCQFCFLVSGRKEALWTGVPSWVDLGDLFFGFQFKFQRY